MSQRSAVHSQKAPPAPAWRTYIWVDSADNTVAKVTDAGGSVVIEPFDLLDASRIAIVADPGGQSSAYGSPVRTRVPSWSTSLGRGL